MSEIVTEVGAKVKATPGIAAAGIVLRPVLQALADGRPASVDVIARAVDRTPDEVARLVAQLPNVELDSRGRVIGIGLSFIPTRHRVYLQGRDHVVYAWCVPDALILPGLIGLSARIISPCHATGQPITVTVEPDGVRDVQPSSAVVSWWPSGIVPQDIRGTGCANQVLFVSAEAAAAWVGQHPGSVVMPVVEAFDTTIRTAKEIGIISGS